MKFSGLKGESISACIIIFIGTELQLLDPGTLCSQGVGDFEVTAVNQTEMLQVRTAVDDGIQFLGIDVAPDECKLPQLAHGLDSELVLAPYIPPADPRAHGKGQWRMGRTPFPFVQDKALELRACPCGDRASNVLDVITAHYREVF
jgi:hypothetical protein